MIKRIFGLVFLVVLNGCAVTYRFEGQKYDSKEKFQQAVDSSMSNALSTITPLPSVLTQRTLVFAIPSETSLFNETLRRHIALNGGQPNSQQTEVYVNLARSTHTAIKVFFDAVQKKNIYASTQFIDMQSITGAIAASPDKDTLYFVEPTQGSGQWFYDSQKHGKQIFAYDRSSPTPAGKLQAFVDAVQAQAIRD